MKKIPNGVGPSFPQVVVLIGATGDLSKRKLMPGLFHLSATGFIPGCRIIGVSLDDLDTAGFREEMHQAVLEFSTRKVDDAAWNAFAETLSYVPLTAGPIALKAAVDEAERSLGKESRRLHYLSVPPNAALSAVRLLGDAGLVDRSRVIMEKPFGTDLASAVRLNAQLHEVFSEDQIFRIDHFLGKEPAQNILAFRFANGLFEPIWNRNFVDHVQIDVPGNIGPRQALGLLRADRRLSRHGGHAPVSDSGLHGHGAADLARARAHQRGEEQGFSQHAAHQAGRCHPRPVHRLPHRGGRRAGFGYRNLHRPEVQHRQLALGRRAVLSAHRQAACRGPANHFHRVPRAAEEHVPRRARGSAPRAPII